jgi:hypothetical protein
LRSDGIGVKAIHVAQHKKAMPPPLAAESWRMWPGVELLDGVQQSMVELPGRFAPRDRWVGHKHLQ